MISSYAFTLSVILFARISAHGQAIDSTIAVPRIIQLRTSLSASYATSQNFQSRDFQNYALNAGLFVQDDRTGEVRKHQHKLLADLGYLKFIDSSWVKGIDRLQVNLLWSRTQRKWTHSYSVMLATQFLPNYTYQYDHESGATREERIGGFASPGVLELGYGATWYPWPRSTIQFAFATAKVNAMPKASLQHADRPHFAETERSVFDMQYGGSLLVNINQPVNERVEWINMSRFFCNAFDRDHVSFDFINKVYVKLFWYVQLRLDTRLGYDPLVNYDLRFSQEVLLGLFYEYPARLR